MEEIYCFDDGLCLFKQPWRDIQLESVWRADFKEYGHPPVHLFVSLVILLIFSLLLKIE